MSDPSEPASTTRQRLLEAAFEVFAEKGYSGTRVQEIAKRAGFTTGAIYANFNGKAALLGEAIGSQGASALQSSMRSMQHDRSAGRMLRDLGVTALLDARRPVDTLLLDALAAAARHPEVALLVQPHLAQWREMIRGLLERSAEKDELREDLTPDAVTTLCVAIGLGSFVLRALELPRAPEAEMRAVMDALVLAFADINEDEEEEDDVTGAAADAPEGGAPAGDLPPDRAR